MELFLHTSLHFPVVLFSFLLCLSILYWIVAAMGILEVDLLDIDADSSSTPEGLAGVLLKLGLHGVPVTLTLTLLFFFAWLMTYYIDLLLLQRLPLGILLYPLGLIVSGICLMAAVPLAGLLVRPLRPFFKKLEVNSNTSVIGRTVVVRSGKVTSVFGEATLEDGGASMIVHVRADEAMGFKRGDPLVLIEYLEHENAYRVVSESAFQGD